MTEFLKPPTPGQLVKVYLDDIKDANGKKGNVVTYGTVIRFGKWGDREVAFLKELDRTDFHITEIDYFLNDNRVYFIGNNGKSVLKF